MTDDDLDRQLRRALSVVPGADLPARIRARIAEDPVPSPAWRWVPAAAGVLAVAGAMAVMLIERAPRFEAPPLAPVALAGVGAVSAAVENAVAARPDVEDGHVSAPTRRRPVAVAASAPAVQLAPGDAEAFRVLLAFSRAATGAAGAEPVAPTNTVDPLSLLAIEIVPIEVAPLVLADEIIQGGSQ